MITVWVHKLCGLYIESELTYSDSEQDYYFPACPTHGIVEMKDIEHIRIEGRE